MDYIVRIGISSDLDKDMLEEALDDAGIPNTVYEVHEDDRRWVLVHRK
jgi:hypothetical protein